MEHNNKMKEAMVGFNGAAKAVAPLLPDAVNNIYKIGMIESVSITKDGFAFSARMIDSDLSRKMQAALGMPPK